MATIPTQKRPKFAIPQLNCDCRYSKKSLHSFGIAGYSHNVAANSATRIGVLYTVLVQQHAPEACFLLSDSRYSMVARTGASSEAPGISSTAGYANPVRAATSEIGVSGGSDKNSVLEAA
ncbi:ash family protein [Escherichia coli]|uniref:ash family protein n=1 Tax=Escherichia coli TaxID=562 RepID=UPI00201CF585|nr:ash family protein [Escherichia coli]